MQAGAVKWTAAQRRVIAETTAALGVGKSNPALPRNVEDFIDRVRSAATDAEARGKLVSCLAGAAKVGAASVSGRLAVLDAGVFAAVEHLDRVAIPSAQNAARSDPDANELVTHRQGLRSGLIETAKAVRAKITQDG